MPMADEHSAICDWKKSPVRWCTPRAERAKRLQRIFEVRSSKSGAISWNKRFLKRYGLVSKNLFAP